MVIKGDPHTPLRATIFSAISTLADNRGNAKRVGQLVGRARAQGEVEFKTTRRMQTRRNTAVGPSRASLCSQY